MTGRHAGGRRRKAEGRALYTVLAVAAVVVAGAAFLIPWLFEYLSDGFSIHQPARKALVRSVLWESPRRVDLPVVGAEQTQEGISRPEDGGPGISPETMETYEPTLSADGRMMIFTRGKARHNADLFTSLRNGAGWTEPEPLASVNSTWDELGPELSRDGRTLYFYSNREGGLGGYDIWVARWNGESWTSPEDLGPGVNSEFNEYGPGLSPDGDRLYFSSNRPQRALTAQEREAWQATLRENFYGSDYDIFVATASALSPAERGAAAPTPPPFRRFAGAARMEILNSPDDEGQVAITPRGDFLYFSSNRNGGLGAFDLYRCRIVQGEFKPPENMGAPVNSARDDMDPSLTLEGHGLLFSSNRRTVGGRRPYLIYRTVSREVFSETDLSGLVALLRALDDIKWPLLLWILGLLALLWLLRFLRSHRFRMYSSLLQRCLLFSLLLHLLLAFLFSTWIVGGALYDMAGDEPGEMFINSDSLAGERIGLEIREQISRIEILADSESFERPTDILQGVAAAQPVESPPRIFEPADPAFDFAPAFPPVALLATAIPFGAPSYASALEELALPARSEALEPPQAAAPQKDPRLTEFNDREKVARMDLSPSPSVTPSPLPAEPKPQALLPDVARDAPSAGPSSLSLDLFPVKAETRPPAVQEELSRHTAAAHPLPPLSGPQPEREMESYVRKTQPDPEETPAKRSARANDRETRRIDKQESTTPIPLAEKRDRPRLDPLRLPDPTPERRPSPLALAAPKRTNRPATEREVPRYRHGKPRTYHGLEMKSRKVVFCLDVSGSMEWNNRIGEARRELLRLLDTLDEGVEFNIIVFSGRVRVWSGSGLQSGAAENVESARRFVRNSRIASDGTNTVGALTAALADEKVESIYFLSDGHPTMGFTTDSDEILQAVRQHQRRRSVVIHTIAYIKGDPPPQYRNDVPPKKRLIDLMQRLAKQNSGHFVLCDK